MSGVSAVGPELDVAVREVVPPWLVPAFVVVTHLGSAGFYLPLFALDYWFGDRRRGAHALALALGGMALFVGLKAFFAAPRPPSELHLVRTDGFAFPSGHAVGATVAYGVLAHDLDLSTRRVRFAVAAAVVALVSLSRVVLGVHYVRDVVWGVLIGVVFLVVALSLTGHAPRLGFLLAGVLGVAAFLVSAGSHDGTGVLGATLAGALTWERLDLTEVVASLVERFALVAGVLPALAVVGYVATRPTVPLPAAFVLNGLVVAGVLAAPLLVRRVA